MVWFTSDTHFGSKRTMELSQRPFKNVKEMDRVLIHNWNSLVSPDDTIYHIGDFGDYTVADELNGRIVLIIGNHEVQDFKQEAIKKLKDYRFAKVVYKLQLTVNGVRFFLAHKPKDCQKSNPRIFNLYGHIHGLQKVKKFGLDVGVDAHHFFPINLESVNFYKNAIRHVYDENVFIQ